MASYSSNNNNAGGYGAYGNSYGQSGFSYGYGGSAALPGSGNSGGAAMPSSYGMGAGSDDAMGSSTLRRRNATTTTGHMSESSSSGHSSFPKRAVVERLDILFPKVDREFTVQTKGGGIMTLAAYGLIAVLCLTEIISWSSQNRSEVSHTFVDTSLGKKMRVNLNITFPALACEDLHVDIIDVAGDSQLNIEDTLKKKQLHLDGSPFSEHEMEVETNQHRSEQAEKERLLKQTLPDNYCGPCYGAQTEGKECCQTCDEVLEAYNRMKWKTDLLKYTSEQCIREGRDRQEPKKMAKGQGCNLAGYMTLNRVSGNFHIAMGEGIERDGRHIHTYLPEDAPNFNASHIIHQLSFGPEDGTEPLSSAIKIVTEDTGVTGLFQYFIKIVPTTFVGESAFPNIHKGADESFVITTDDGKEKAIETNRYFVTERFMPLMTELLEDKHRDGDRAAVHAGYSGSHTNQHHHHKQNAVLPGVFFIYEIYPFAVEIRRNSVPLTHLLIRLMATVGGVITVVKWLDSWLYERGSHKSAPTPYR